MHPNRYFAGRMTKVSTFIQRYPHDGESASQKTDVYIAHDARRLYVVWVCWDNEPHLIRARLSEREDVWGDDTVEVLLDSFHDHVVRQN